jgi:cytochrome c peroxidase
MRFAGGYESRDPENAGLAAARAFLEPIKLKYPSVSYSDLWILASYVGLEHTGGPVIPFVSGRVDHIDPSYWSRTGMSYGRLPAAEKYCCPHLDDSNVSSSIDPSTGTVRGWEGLCTHVRNEVFYRMGFDDREIVSLLCGGHVYGRCHANASGYAGAWVENPTRFSNEYAADMIEDDWTLVSNGDKWLIGMGAEELIPAPGKRQFVNKVPGRIVEDGGDGANQMMLLSDMILKWDPTFRHYLEMYAEDEELLKSDFGAAFKKLTELGCGF